MCGDNRGSDEGIQQKGIAELARKKRKSKKARGYGFNFGIGRKKTRTRSSSPGARIVGIVFIMIVVAAAMAVGLFYLEKYVDAEKPIAAGYGRLAAKLFLSLRHPYGICVHQAEGPGVMGII